MKTLFALFALLECFINEIKIKENAHTNKNEEELFDILATVMDSRLRIIPKTLSPDELKFIKKLEKTQKNLVNQDILNDTISSIITMIKTVDSTDISLAILAGFERKRQLDVLAQIDLESSGVH